MARRPATLDASCEGGRLVERRGRGRGKEGVRTHEIGESLLELPERPNRNDGSKQAAVDKVEHLVRVDEIAG